MDNEGTFSSSVHFWRVAPVVPFAAMVAFLMLALGLFFFGEECSDCDLHDLSREVVRGCVYGMGRVLEQD